MWGEKWCRWHVPCGTCHNVFFAFSHLEPERLGRFRRVKDHSTARWTADMAAPLAVPSGQNRKPVWFIRFFALGARTAGPIDTKFCQPTISMIGFRTIDTLSVNRYLIGILSISHISIPILTPRQRRAMPASSSESE